MLDNNRRKLKFIVTQEEIQDYAYKFQHGVHDYNFLCHKVKPLGYIHLDGDFEFVNYDDSFVWEFIYTLSRRDILFKQFPKWSPKE